MMLAPRAKLSSTQSLHPAGNPEALTEKGAQPAWFWRKVLLHSGCLALEVWAGTGHQAAQTAKHSPSPPSRAERPHHTVAMTDL